MKQIITIRGKPVIEIYESFDGSYWFITEKLYKQDSVIHGKMYKNDQILFGFVRLSACPQFAEWGNISETELKLLGSWVWKVPRINWPFCPEVEVSFVAEPGESKTPGFLCSNDEQKQQKGVKIQAENQSVKKKMKVNCLHKGIKGNLKKLSREQTLVLIFEEMPKNFKASEGKKRQITRRGNNFQSLDEEDEEGQDMGRGAVSGNYSFLTQAGRDVRAAWKPIFIEKDYERYRNKQEISGQYRQQRQTPAHYEGNYEKNYQIPLHIDYHRFSRKRQPGIYQRLHKMTGKNHYLSRRIKLGNMYGKQPENSFDWNRQALYKSLESYLR